MYSTECYLDTFCPAVKEAYLSDMENGYAFIHPGGESMDDWLSENGSYVFKNRQDLPRKLRLELRPYWGSAGGAKIYVIPEVSPAAFSQLLSSLNAVDIVSVNGLSIVSATRAAIARNGPEFFVVPNEGEFPSELPHDHSYLANKDRLMKAFLDTLVGIVASNVARAVTMVQTRDQVRKLFRTLPQILKMATDDAMKNARVTDEISKRTYGCGEFSTMIHSECTSHRYKTRAEDFAALLHEKIGACLVNDEVTDWAKRDLPFLGHETVGDPEDVRHTKLARAIRKSVKRSRKDPFTDLLHHLNGGSTKRRRKRRRVKKKRVAPEGIGASIWHGIQKTCPHCDDFECEDGKSHRRAGELLEFTNPSTKCPRSVFSERMKRDAGLRRCVRGMTSISSNHSLEGIQGVLVCPQGQLFDPETHMFSMKQVRKVDGIEGLASKPLIGRDGEVKYRVIGNRLVSKEDSTEFMEHTDARIPNALVLMAVD